jgi:hypothetical protein
MKVVPKSCGSALFAALKGIVILQIADLPFTRSAEITHGTAGFEGI